MCEKNISNGVIKRWPNDFPVNGTDISKCAVD